MKVVTEITELGEQGKKAARAIVVSTEQYHRAFDKLGVALVSFLVACHQDEVILQQKDLAALAKCSKGYVSRITKAVEESHKEVKDYLKVEELARTSGVSTFLEKYAPVKIAEIKQPAVASGNVSQDSPVSKVSEILPAKVRKHPVELQAVDLMAMAQTLRTQVQYNLPKLSFGQRKELASAIMDIWDMLEASPLGTSVAQEVRANA